MKNRLLPVLGLCVTLGLFSCEKDNDSDNQPPVTPCSDTSNVLTNKTWVYYEYYQNFNDPATKLAFKTGRTSNTLTLTKNEVKFNCDSTYTEIDENGVTYKGTWKYINNGTQTQVVNSKGTFISTIKVSTANRYEWLADNGTYGVMQPKNLVLDATGGTMALLTAKSWVYTVYFNNYGAAAPSLVWKNNKANSTLNLSKNIVKYNTNGTYTETDEYGVVYNGTWTFLNNDTEVRVTNSKGTFTSIIKLLSTDRYEWLDKGGITYGEMMHP